MRPTSAPEPALLPRLYAATLRLLPSRYDAEDRAAMLETFSARHRCMHPGVARLALLVREVGGVLRLAIGRGEPRARPQRRARRDGGSPRLRQPAPCRTSPALRALPTTERRAGRGSVPSAGHVVAWLQEIRHAARRLLRAPGFTVATVLTLAVAAGGTAALFTVVHAILLDPLPYPDAKRLVAVRSASPPAGADDMEMSVGLYLHYREQVDAFASIALYERVYRNLTADGEPARLETVRSTGELFATLGVEPALGRVLGPADTSADAADVVVLADTLWRTRYGADPDIVGRTVLLDDRPFTVVGVMPPGFAFPAPGMQAWTAWSIDAGRMPLMSFSYDAIARLAPGATHADADAGLQRALTSYPEAFGWERTDWERLGLVGFVRDLRDHAIGDVGPTLWLFAGAGAFVLLLAGANVANLFLARSESRLDDARIRSALGASRLQLLGHGTAEGLCVAVLAAVVGLALAAAGLRAVVLMAPDLPRIEGIAIGGATLAFLAVLTAVVALLLGAAPLLATAGSNHGALGGRRTATAGVTASRGREILVGVQVALALTLSVGAALMLQSVANLTAADPGFDPRGVLTFRLSLPENDYPDRAAAALFHQQLVERLQTLPGVESAAVARCLPLQGWCGGNQVASPDSPLPADAFRQVVSVKPVSAGYFETVRIPLLAGRTLEPADQTRRSGAALVSDALAARLFPGLAPAAVLGRRIYPQGELQVDEWFTIVGVVAAVQRSRIEEPPAEMLYVPLLGVDDDRHLAPIHDVTVAVRVAGEPLAALDAARGVVHGLDAHLPVARVDTLAGIHAAASARTRFTSLLLTLAAATGLLLGSVGIYGVTSWATRQRSAELGVRAALGARGRDLLSMVMVRTLGVIGAGLVAGIGASLVAGRLLAAMLYRIEAHDPATFLAVIATLLAVGLTATWIPARRAARTDPVDALRSG